MEKQKNTCTEQGRSVPKLRFPEFNDNWSRIKLGQLSELITKGTTPNIFINSGINFIKIECFDGDIINKERCLFIDSKIHNGELRRSILEDGDILFAIAGATIGKCCIVTKEILPANTNQALSIIRLKNDNNRQFIYNVLKSHYMQKYIKDNISVGAQPNLNLEQMGNFSFKLPSLPEQQKIASFLTSVDERIAQLTKKKALLEQYKKGVMQKIFSQEIRFKDDNGREFPNWEEKRLGEITNIKKGEQLNTTELLDIGIYPALNGGINPSGYTDKWNTPENTISISEGGNSCGFVNFNKQKFWSGGHCYTLQQIKTDVYIHFLYQELKFNEQNLMSLRVGSGLPNIQKKDLINFILPIPTHKEQTKIANFLSAIDKRIEGVAEVLEATQRWKKGLLQQMFC